MDIKIVKYHRFPSIEQQSFFAFFEQYLFEDMSHVQELVMLTKFILSGQKYFNHTHSWHCQKVNFAAWILE